MEQHLARRLWGDAGPWRVGSGGCRSLGHPASHRWACEGWVMQSIPSGWDGAAPLCIPIPGDGECWKNIWMHPWIEGDKQGAAPIWGWAWRCCHSGRQEELVQGERWGKSLAAASGCGIHPRIYSITIKQPKPVPTQATAETAQHCPPLPSGAAHSDGEDSLGLIEGDGTAPSLPVTC